MSKITINIIQAKIRTIHEFMRKDDRNPVLTFILARDKPYNLMQKIQEQINRQAPRETISTSKGGWVVLEDAIAVFSSNGIFNVMVDGCHLARGKYLGKKKGEKATWCGWLKERRKE